MPEIIEYQECWPIEFQAIASHLRHGLGSIAIRIDHIGSTAVPGLAAKNIIDVQISVASLDEERISAITALGYSLFEAVTRDHRPPGAVGPESDWEKRFFLQPTGRRRTNVHLRVQGRPNQRYALLFRDYLRTHPATADAYAELKRRLFQNLADPKTYPDVKDPAVDLIYLAAEEWALATGWEPGKSEA